MISLDSYKEAFLHLPAGAKEAEVNAETHDRIDTAVSGGQVNDTQFSRSTELFIRVSGDKTGYAYTQNPSEDPAAILKTAYENGSCSDREEADAMNRKPQILHIGSDAVLPPAAQVSDKALKLEDKFKEYLQDRSDDIEVQIWLSAELYGQHTVNSHGLDVSAYSVFYILSAGLVTKEGFFQSEIVTCAEGGFDPDSEEVRKLAQSMIWRAESLKKPAQGFVSGEQEVILSEDAVSQMFMTAWQEFSAAKYRDKACCLSGLLGEKISSEALTIADITDPAEGGYPAFCDAEGTPGKNSFIIEKGILKGLLTNQTTAQQMDLPATGNAGRRPLLFGNIATDILVTPKNFCILPGTASLKEMEEHMGNGIVITEYFDLFHSLDISSGNFSVPCYGILIRDGKEAGSLTGLTMSGNFRKMLAGIKEAGSFRLIHPMNFLRNYGIGSCPLAVGKLNISGE